MLNHYYHHHQNATYSNYWEDGRNNNTNGSLLEKSRLYRHAGTHQPPPRSGTKEWDEPLSLDMTSISQLSIKE